MPSVPLKYCLNKGINLSRLQPLITSKVTSKGMGDKIAGSGLMLNHLKLSFISGEWFGRAQKCFDRKN